MGSTGDNAYVTREAFWLIQYTQVVYFFQIIALTPTLSCN